MPEEFDPKPDNWLRAAVKAVPSVKYAVGVLGLVSVVYSVVKIHLEPKQLVIGLVLLFVAMFLLLIFSSVAKTEASAHLKPIGVFMAWCFGIGLVGFAVALAYQFLFLPPETTQPRASHFAGTVVDSNTRAAISGAVVTIFSEGTPATVTDSNGFFDISSTSSADSRRTISVEKDGYVEVREDILPSSQLSFSLVRNTQPHTAHSAAPVFPVSAPVPTESRAPDPAQSRPIQPPTVQTPHASIYSRVQSSLNDLQGIMNGYYPNYMAEIAREHHDHPERVGKPALTPEQIETNRTSDLQARYDNEKSVHQQLMDWAARFAPIRQEALDCTGVLAAIPRSEDDRLYGAAVDRASVVWGLDQLKKESLDAKKFDLILAYVKNLSEKAGMKPACGR